MVDTGILTRVEMAPELGSLEWWISGLLLNPLFMLISRLTSSRDYVSLEIKYLDQQI